MDNTTQKRDWFAALAMQAILQQKQDSSGKSFVAGEFGVDYNWGNHNNNFNRLAKCSYKIADAMLKERSKKDE